MKEEWSGKTHNLLDEDVDFITAPFYDLYRWTIADYSFPLTCENKKFENCHQVLDFFSKFRGFTTKIRLACPSINCFEVKRF